MEDKTALSLNDAVRLFRRANVSAHAAQTAFFMLLSLVPFCVSLSAALLSFSAVTALWSASRGMVALTRGLNEMYGVTETRGILRLRLFALAETLVLILALTCTAGGALWGETILDRLGASGGAAAGLRAGGGIAVLSVFFLFFYTVLPNHSPPLKTQATGAALTAVGWILCTEVFSFYTERVADFPRLYGTLSNAAMLMLWMYLCLYLLFSGALFNRLLNGT